MVGKNEAAFVLVADGLKGLIAVLIGRLLGVDGFLLGCVALAAVIGHIFPLYFQFKGGRGVATAIGSILGLSFWAGILILAIWIGVTFFSRIVSLASLAALGAAPFLILIFGRIGYFIPVVIIAALVYWKHKDNIMRLKGGTEPKVQF